MAEDKSYWGKTDSTFLKDDYLQVKATYFSNEDVRTTDEATPFGMDSNVPRGCLSVYLETTDMASHVVVGYVLKNRQADMGETRLYSTDGELAEKAAIWLRNTGDITFRNDNCRVVYNHNGDVRHANQSSYYSLKADGTIELRGTAHNAVRYTPLETAFNELKNKFNHLVADINNLKSAFNTWVPASGDGGAALKTAATTWISATADTSTADITPAKIDEIKTS